MLKGVTLNGSLSTIIDMYYNANFKAEYPYLELKKLSLKYGECDVAKECLKMKHENETIKLLFFLAVSGNKKTEKYLEFLLENTKDYDYILEITIGLLAINSNKYVKRIKSYLMNPIQLELTLEDIYAYLLTVIIRSQEVKSLIKDIENGVYGNASFINSYNGERELHNKLYNYFTKNYK